MSGPVYFHCVPFYNNKKEKKIVKIILNMIAQMLSLPHFVSVTYFNDPDWS